MTDSAQEIEAGFLICSDEPEGVADAIAHLDRLGDYRLTLEADQSIQDIHFDAGESVYWLKGVALRARYKNGKMLITLKGPPQVNANGLVTRLELEYPWNADGVKRIAEALRTLKMPIPPLPDTLDASAGAGALRDSGFRVLQSRTTHRRVRAVSTVDELTMAAEFAIDAIRYHLGLSTVSAFEIEIEAKADNGHATIGACSNALMAQFGAKLRPWPYGKLVTGKSIASLLENGELDPLLEAGNVVGSTACDAIQRHIRLTRQLAEPE